MIGNGGFATLRRIKVEEIHLQHKFVNCVMRSLKIIKNKIIEKIIIKLTSQHSMMLCKVHFHFQMLCF